MKRFIEGEDRHQVTLLPECLDDFVGEDNPVRVVDAFVEELDLEALGFEGIEPASTRPARDEPERAGLQHEAGDEPARYRQNSEGDAACWGLSPLNQPPTAQIGLPKLSQALRIHVEWNALASFTRN